MTNLNKEIRAAVIESVIKGTYIPEQKAAILAATSKAVRDLVVLALPEGFAVATATLPPQWFGSVSHFDVCKEQCPRAILDGADRWKGYGSVLIKFESVITPPHHNIHSLLLQDKKSGNNESWTQFWERHLAAQIAAATKLRAKEDALRSELGAFLASVKTYKQVVEKMPELERHLPPPPTKVFALVTSTAPLEKALTSLGFDRTKEAA